MLPKTPPSSWPWTHAREFAAAHGVDLAPHEPALASWLDLLVGWNARLDLTAARGVEELIALMLADVIVLAGKLPRAAEGATEPLRVVDVGTGAGAPGLGLAIVRSDLRVTLCEPLQKRAAFLRTVLGTLRRNDVTLTVARGDALPKNAFDVAISRATLAPPEWLKLAETLIEAEATKDGAPAPEAWVLLARDEAPTAAGMVAAEEHLYKWPIDGHDRRAVRYRRGQSETATERVPEPSRTRKS